jgi:small GTP-binding protein
MRPVPGDSKVVLLGDASVGKTSILHNYNTHRFDENLDPTVGATFVSKLVQTKSGPVQVNIWDTAGQERYRSLVPMYTRNAVAAVIVMDVTNLESYENLDEWVCLAKARCARNCSIYVAANKIDLEPTIPMRELEKWGVAQGIQVFKVSAKHYQGIDRLFECVAEGVQMRGTVLASDPIPENRENSPCCSRAAGPRPPGRS